MTDLRRDDVKVDWISVEDENSGISSPSAATLVRQVVARGGCDLMPVAHYLGYISDTVVGEFNDNRCGMDGRIDHSVFLRIALSGGLGKEALEAAAKLGYQERDFTSAIAGPSHPSDVWVISFWTDAAYVLYKHRKYGFSLPFSLTGYHNRDARLADIETLRHAGFDEHVLRGVVSLKEDYEYSGFIVEHDFKATLHQLFRAALAGPRVFVVAANEYYIEKNGVGQIMALTRSQNTWLREVSSGYNFVTVLDIRDHIHDEEEVHSPYHFDRMVYFRLFESIKSLVSGGGGPLYPRWALHSAKDLDETLSNTNSAHALSRTAAFLLDGGNVNYAVLFARKAIELEPDVITHRLVYLEAALRSGDAHCRGDIKQFILDNSTLPASVLHRCGNFLVASGMLQEAEDAFRRAARAEPMIFHHRHRLANVLQSLGRLDECYAVLKSCLDDGDSNLHVMAHVARLLISFGELRGARLFLEGCSLKADNFRPFDEAFLSLRAAEEISAGS